MKSYEEKTQQYSTWGDKILQHTDVLHSIQYEDTFKPINIQLAPCEVCDSDCPFCSVAGRPMKSHMKWEEVCLTLDAFKRLGAKALEITGGGNPLLYRDKVAKKDINDIIAYAGNLGYNIGIITNTEKLERHLKPEVYPFIDWIRVSLIKLEERIAPEDYDFGSFPTERLGLSYIIHDSTKGVADPMSRTGKPYPGTSVESIDKIARLIDLHPAIKFVRVAGDVLVENNQPEIKKQWGPMLEAIDVHDKVFIKEIYTNEYAYNDGCYVGLIRPYIAPSPDGGDYQVYACTSHVLEKRIYNLDFSLGSIQDIEKIWNDANIHYAKHGYPYEVRGNKGKDWCTSCGLCYYNNNNRVLHTVAQEMHDKNFA